MQPLPWPARTTAQTLTGLCRTTNYRQITSRRQWHQHSHWADDMQGRTKTLIFEMNMRSGRQVNSQLLFQKEIDRSKEAIRVFQIRDWLSKETIRTTADQQHIIIRWETCMKMKMASAENNTTLSDLRTITLNWQLTSLTYKIQHLMDEK
jgi:hypothetical protein